MTKTELCGKEYGKSDEGLMLIEKEDIFRASFSNGTDIRTRRAHLIKHGKNKQGLKIDFPKEIMEEVLEQKIWVLIRNIKNQKKKESMIVFEDFDSLELFATELEKVVKYYKTVNQTGKMMDSIRTKAIRINKELDMIKTKNE